MEERLISIDDIIRIIKKRLRILLIITFSFTLVSAILSFFIIKPKYEASTKFFIGKEATGENQSYSQSDVIMYQTLMKTYSEVIRTTDIIARAITEGNINLKADEVLKKLSVITIADTQILEVKFKSKNPREARDLIEGITKEFINISKELFPNGHVKILQEVRLPEKPVSPNKKINIAIGFLIGLIVSIGVAFLLEILDKRIRIKEQLEIEFHMPVIGVIPHMENE